jgi:hypothetical protein
MGVHVCAPKRSDTVKGKLVSASRICITKRGKHHSSIKEVCKFKKIERIVPHVPFNSNSATFTCSRFHPSGSCGASSFQNIMSRGAGVLLACSVSLLRFSINSRRSMGNAYAELKSSEILVRRVYLGEVPHNSLYHL